MTSIGFIGLGNMGGPMAANLLKAKLDLTGYDVSAAALEVFVSQGGKRADGIADAAAGKDVIITMLPAGPHVRQVYSSSGGIFEHARKGALLIDCSTIDVETARSVAAHADELGFKMLDAPVSGGTAGAAAATLTFMVGGDAGAFQRAEPILSKMGKTIVHAGPAGTGQAAKICNNLILGISMVAVCEGFALAERLGLDEQKLFDISSKSSGQCWSLTSYCPVPGPVPAAPSNRDYAPGFTAEMMLKDLKLAQQAAIASGTATPLGAAAAALYGLLVNSGLGARDFSVMASFIKGRANTPNVTKN
jgi:3-hydroxyisobutyrate dehydrogenase